MLPHSNQPRRALLSSYVPVTFAVTVLAAVSWAPAAWAQLPQGHILVADPDAGGLSNLGRVFLVEPQSGARTTVTDFGTMPDTGGIDPRWIALERDGGILIVDQTAGTNDLGALIRVDPTTGTPAILSDFGDSNQGFLGGNPQGVAVEADGQILVMDMGSAQSPSRLFRINPVTGLRSVLSDFSVAPNTGFGSALALEADGQILVLDQSGIVKILRVNPTDGTRSVAHQLTQGPNPASAPRGIAVELTGTILVVDLVAGTNGDGALFRIDPSTGSRVRLSDFGDVAQGPLARDSFQVAVGTAGEIFVSNPIVGTSGSGALFSVDPVSGNRVLISDFGNSAQGDLGLNPFGLVVVPPPPATLIVVKEVVNDNGGSSVAADWTMTVTGGHPLPATFTGEGSPGTSVMLDAGGAYSVSASGPTGYATTMSADCVGTIASGEIRTCTITSDDQPGTLVVATEVVNDNGGANIAADWTTTVTGVNSSPQNFSGASIPGTTVTLDPGSYAVGDTGPAGYSTSPSVNCSGSIAAGETRTCTITHDDQPATLIVVTEVVNNNGGTHVAGDWTITVTGNNPSPASFSGTPPPGTTVTLNAGSYSVGATGPAGYTSTMSTGCSGTAAVGDTRSCTMSHDDIPPVVPMCNGKVATIVGAPGPTELRGTTGDDVIVDLDGDNIVRGRGGNDTVCTGAGNDQVYLGAGNDTVIDTGGQNIVDGAGGADTITTGAGADRIDGGAGVDTCTPGAGLNVVKKCEIVR